MCYELAEPEIQNKPTPSSKAWLTHNQVTVCVTAALLQERPVNFLYTAFNMVLLPICTNYYSSTFKMLYA